MAKVFGSYFLAKENGSYRIRRIIMDDGVKRMVRYPFEKYKHLKEKSEFDQLILRLNHREDQKQKDAIEVRMAFLEPGLLESFRSMLEVSIPSQRDFNYIYGKAFQDYFLDFFVVHLNLKDPTQWSRHQEKWGASLLGKAEYKIFNYQPSKKTLKTIIQVANRFMKFLNQKMPESYPLAVLSPLSKSAIKEHEAVRLMNIEEPTGLYITDKEWLEIQPKLPDDLQAYVNLMYHYGLRRAESLGFLSVDALKKGHLEVRRQYVSKAKGTQPLKNRDNRKVPHWFCSPSVTYEWLLRAAKDEKVHPDTLYKKWKQFCKTANLNIDLHDFRRTFITNALRTQNPRDVQLAVGHFSIHTTMQYAQDDRSFDEEVWTPDKAI